MSDKGREEDVDGAPSEPEEPAGPQVPDRPAEPADADIPESVEPGEGVEPGEAATPETGETSGLGLTEEFERIEAEIERELADSSEGVAAERAAAGGEPAGGTGEPSAAESGDEDPDEADEADAADADPAEAEQSADEPEVGAGAATAGDADAGEDGDAGADDAGGEQRTEVAPVTQDRDPATVLQSAQRITRPVPQTAVPIAAAIRDEDLDVKIPSLWLRFLSGSVLIVASMAAAVAVTGLLFFSDVAAKLQPIPGIDKQLDEVASEDPQTVMIIGSDRREGDGKGDKRSDTTMLLRVDPDKKVLSLFSLPRDLKVDVPGVGPTKLNEAYTIGGSELTLKTVKRFTGIDINHVVEINFQGFADAVNAIDCVYIDVDRKYFNVNDGTVANDYADIDINAGYQRLCGLKALQYVRYRHFDNDLVRAARQQDFLREARQKVEPRQLVPLFGGQGNELIDIFTDYTRSDIADENDVIGILKSFISVRDVPVNEVHFKGDIGGPDDPFVTSTDKQVEKAIDEFLNGVGSEGQRGGEDANEKKEEKKKDKKKKKPEDDADVVATDQLGDEKFGSMAERLETDAAKNERRLEIPAFYPTALVPGTGFDSGSSRTYDYEAEDKKRESAYKTVLTLGSPTTVTEYYGFMGTSWSDPPILRNPSETRKMNGREFLLFYDGDRLRLVGWKEKGNSYWLNNTLIQSIGEAEMLAMAASIEEA